MRTTKYRGVKIGSDEIIYGDLLCNNSSPIIVEQATRDYIQRAEASGGSHWYIDVPAFKVIPESVEEFIGKYDIEGKEGKILQGDYITVREHGFNGGYYNYTFIDRETLTPLRLKGGEEFEIAGKKRIKTELLTKTNSNYNILT